MNCRRDEKARAAAPVDREIKTSVLLFLVSVHQVKTGRLPEAVALCDQIATLIPETETNPKLKTTLA